MIDVNNENDVINLIVKIFNTYNGRVNVINRAKLHIDWTYQYGKSDGGTYRNPNIVTIFPNVIRRFFKKPYVFKFNCAVCTIHELYHADQLLDFIKLKYNEEYKNLIENLVEMESWLYISHHRNEISNIIEENIDMDTPYYPILRGQYETGKMYQRTDYLSHLICILQEITRSSTNDVIDKFIMTHLQKQTIIILDINGYQYIIKDRNWTLPIDIINSIFEERFFKHNLRTNLVVSMPKVGPNTHILKIETLCKDRIYNLIK